MSTAPANPIPSYASASLYVGDLAPEVTEALLFEIFNAVGPVASVRVCRDAAVRRSLGYAYVNFHRVEDAERALDTMNFKNIRNKACRIMWSHRDPSLRRSGLGNIFVKNLARSIDNKRLYDTFSMFGNILSCKVSTNRSGESLGYGFVHYESEEAAQTAISKVDGKVIAGEQVNVSAFKSRKERGGDKFRFTNVYVKNLPNIGKEQLEELFGKYGTVTSSMISQSSNSDKVFAFVNFATPEMAAASVEGTNGMKIEDKELYVVRAQKKEEREKELRERFENLRVERQRKNAGTNLYVKNLSDDMTDSKLREEFGKFGGITSAKIMSDSTAKSKGFGFVCFSSPEEATKAVTEMNGRMVDNKPLYVALAQRKDQRRAQLEAQHASRAKMGGVPVPQPQMFPQGMQMAGPPSGPIFYQGMPQQRGNFVYPAQQMMARQWNPNHQQQQQVGMMGGGRPHPGQQFQLMQLNQRQGQQQGGQQQQRPQRGGPQRGQPNRSVPQPQKEAVVQPQGGRAEPLTIKALAAAPEEQKKQMIGERLFPLIKQQQPTLAGKITGMLLEMDNGELLHLLESNEALSEKVGEALIVLTQAGDEK